MTSYIACWYSVDCIGDSMATLQQPIMIGCWSVAIVSPIQSPYDAIIIRIGKELAVCETSQKRINWKFTRR
jgi:hypothetical protein